MAAAILSYNGSESRNAESVGHFA